MDWDGLPSCLFELSQSHTQTQIVALVNDIQEQQPDPAVGAPPGVAERVAWGQLEGVI